MELIGSLFLLLALILLVAVYVGRPFLRRAAVTEVEAPSVEQERDHRRSSLLAERDRLLSALQDLDFDFALGKVPPEDYPLQRAALLKSGADVLRRLDAVEAEADHAAGKVAAHARSAAVSAGGASPEERIEAAVAARRADSVQAGRQAAVVTGGGNGATRGGRDELEEIIARRKRERQESASGFCPQCGKPAQKSDKFCSRCGATL